MFFFSSRRRHTRLQGDWSSDVCSSDLSATGARSRYDMRSRYQQRLPAAAEAVVVGAGVVGAAIAYHLAREGMSVAVVRSEERRVGKECRCTWGGAAQRKRTSR